MNKNTYEETMEAIRQFRKKVKHWSKEQCHEYLVELGTHNPDGTLTEEYGGKYTMKNNMFEVWITQGQGGTLVKKYKTLWGH